MAGGQKWVLRNLQSLNYLQEGSETPAQTRTHTRLLTQLRAMEPVHSGCHNYSDQEKSNIIGVFRSNSDMYCTVRFRSTKDYQTNTDVKPHHDCRKGYLATSVTAPCRNPLFSTQHARLHLTRQELRRQTSRDETFSK